MKSFKCFAVLMVCLFMETGNALACGMDKAFSSYLFCASDLTPITEEPLLDAIDIDVMVRHYDFALYLYHAKPDPKSYSGLQLGVIEHKGIRAPPY